MIYGLAPTWHQRKNTYPFDEFTANEILGDVQESA